MLLKKQIRKGLKLSRCEGILFVRLRPMLGGYQRKCNFCKLYDPCKGCLGDKIKMEDISFISPGNLGDYCRGRIGMFHIPFEYIKNLKDVIQEGSFT